MDLAALKTELDAGHPDTGAYSADDVEAAEQLNAKNRTPDRDSLQSGELIASIVGTEYAALSNIEKDYVRLVAMAEILPLTQTLKSQLGTLFPAQSQTRANLRSLLKRTGSRAEELGLGFVTPSHVADARRLP